MNIPRSGEPPARRPQHGGEEWPAETIDRLTQLWDGVHPPLSCADIARQLGRSKNSVVGKAHRLGLPPRPSPIQPAGSGLRPGERQARIRRAGAGVPTLPPLASAETTKPKRKRRSPRQNVPPPPPRVLDHGRLGGTQNSPRHTLPQLAPAAPVRAPRPPPPPRKCAWPLNSGRPWRFCDAPSEAGTPYCPDHCLAAYPQRRDREETA